jgi:hypothetical protein
LAAGIAVHYAFCLKGNRKEAVASTTVSTEGPEMTLSEDTNPFISLAAESSPEDTEEGDLSQRVIPVTTSPTEFYFQLN